MNKIPTLYLIILFIFSSQASSSAATSDPQPDSALNLSSSYEQLSSRTKVLVAQEFINSRVEFNAHQAVIQQSQTFVLIKNEIEKARNFLRQGYSYRAIKEEIDRLTEWKNMACEGVVTNKDKVQTVRNLTTTSILLKELLNRTNSRLQQITDYQKTLGQFQYNLDSLLMDSVLYCVPNDSVSLIRYFQRLMLLNKDYKPVNDPLRVALDSIENLEIKVSMIKFSLESDIAETESQRKALFEKIGIIETGTLGKGIPGDQSVGDVLAFSLKKAELVLWFYAVNHLISIILMFLFIFGIAFYLIMLGRKARVDHLRETSEHDVHVLSHPIASATLMVITVFQFFLPLPPFVFSGLLWIICGIAVSVIIRKSVTPLRFSSWLLFFFLFLIGFAGNLLLRQSVFERWTMLVFMLSGLAAGLFFLVKLNKQEIKENLILIFIGLMIVCEILAIINYLSEGYNQAKTFMVSGVFIVIVSYFLFWTARLGNNTLRMSLYFLKGPDDEHPAGFKEKSGKSWPLWFYLLFFIGCFILISRNFYFYQTIFEPLSEALIAARTIGAFTFTYQSIIVFFGVLILSGIISQVVSFLASDTTAVHGKPASGGVGSWLLLIRIAIITTGVMLAFVSAGIPMDKFAIIIGALSVGIGFGLQTLINNLVSGLIIAFEKPVNVGDIVEITGQIGKMKSIGIRSSVVTTWDGANVIIPNGDLLNQHLVNWTMGSSRRRFDLTLGVAYGTDLGKTKQLLLDLMLTDPRILKNPEPIVLALDFNSSSVDLILKFWVSHFAIGFDVKSDLIVAVDKLFKEHGVVIPFPQQDVYVRSSASLPEKEADESL
ncbi:MAG: mechanosensitive ion channel [Bacteroidetes bacterium]|nr:mechanosensitive ion channel [Bacteroidota bacterium]